jgi:hypothetical protein
MCIAVNKLSNVYIFTVSLYEGKEVANTVGQVLVDTVYSYAGICMQCSLVLVIV